jgi:mRNA-degrading endonuclease RelE of RelBE toxin-antitoxin system
MVNVSYHDDFKKQFQKIDASFRFKIKKQITKILGNPEIGKPMRYGRKYTRELYIKPYRLSYMYLKEKDEVVLLCLYHKDKQ